MFTILMELNCLQDYERHLKVDRIWSFSGPHFPTFGPEKLRIRVLFMQWS